MAANDKVPVRLESGYRYDNEISVVDLWLVLTRYKLLILFSVVCIGAVGGAYALLTPARYEYSMSIQIGARLASDEYRLVEPASSVVAKINNGYLPLLHRELAPERTSLPIEARSISDSGLIVVSGVAREKDSQLILGVLDKLAEKVVEDHAERSIALRAQLIAQQQQAKERLAGLEEHAAELRERVGRLENVEGELTSSAEGIRGGALLIHLRTTEQVESLRQDLLDNAALQREERALLAELAGRLAAFRDTELVVEPNQSLEPVDTRPSLTVMLSLALGLVLGVFGAFFAAFLQHVEAVQQSAR